MKNKKKVRSVLLIVLLVLALSIGFALLSTTLNINGLAFIKPNTWDIHWENVAKEAGVEPVSPATINANDNKLVEFEADFTIPGDYYEFEVDAVNRGTIDGMLKEIKFTINGDTLGDLSNYLDYTIMYANGSEPQEKDLLESGKRVTYKIKLEYKTTISNEDLENIPNEGDPFVGEVEIVYIQADDEATPPDAAENIPDNFADDDWPTIVDEGDRAATQPTTTGTCGAYNIGDEKTIAMDLDDDGVDETYTVRIANCSTPDICKTAGFSQTACGFVIEFKDIITTHKMNNALDYNSNGSQNIGGWKYSDMRAYLNNGIYTYGNVDYSDNGFYSKLPAELRNHISDTYAVSGQGCLQYSSSDVHVCTLEDNNGKNFETTDKVYLLSAKEIYGKTSETPLVAYDAGEGRTRQLDYYNNIGVRDDNSHMGGAKKDVANNPDADVRQKRWWTRTAVHDLQSGWNFYEVESIGYCEIAYPAANYGVSPAFRLN